MTHDVFTIKIVWIYFKNNRFDIFILLIGVGPTGSKGKTPFNDKVQIIASFKLRNCFTTRQT